MESIRDFSLEVTRWLQENYPQLESFFLILSGIGRFEFYLAIIALIYWSIEKFFGRSLAYILAFSFLINGMIKHLIRDPRPYWLDPTLGLYEENSYGVPSGHAQAATVFYGFLALWLRRGWVWVLAILMMLLMALSRVYLGVHDIEDVLAGIIIGILILIGYYFWQRYFEDRFANRILGQRLLFAILVPVLLVIAYAGLLIILGQPDYDVAWSEYIDAAEWTSFEDIAAEFGILLGLGVGFVLEVSRVRFMVHGALWKRIVRYLVGLAGTIVIWFGLDTIFPEEPLALAVPLRLFQAFLMAIWISYYAPWLFVKVRLAKARPEPEVSITI
ncbi:MAG: phosphatase PAP2 family protein [Chloroflexota bacterium]|jgi:membrane-associated phospholipid phosphatase